MKLFYEANLSFFCFCSRQGEDPSIRKLDDPDILEHHVTGNEEAEDRSPHHVGWVLAKAFELGQDHHLLVCNIETVCSVELDLLLHPHSVGWLDVQLVAFPVLLTFTDRFCVWRGRGLAALDCRVFPEYRDQKLTQS